MLIAVPVPQPKQRRQEHLRIQSVTLLFALLVAADPVLAIDTLVVGEGQRLRSWRSLADWGQVDKVTVRPDSIFKWDVSPRDNLAPGLVERQGRMTAFAVVFDEETETDTLVELAVPNMALLVDGDGSTAFDPDEAGEGGIPRDVIMFIDLGASFSINRIRMHPRLDSEHRILFPQQFIVATANGESIEGPYQSIPQLSFSSVLPNVEPIIDRVFASRQARYVRIVMSAVQPWELAEFEVYGDGTVPVGQYQIQPVPAPRSFPVWGRVTTDAGPISELPIVMQTRTGPDRSPIQYFIYTGVGDEIRDVGRAIWEAVPEEEQGPVQANPEWSDWTTVSDNQIRSIELHRYIQFRLRFSEPGTKLHKMFIEFSEPGIVERLQSEVDPRIVSPGVEQAFTLSILSHTISQGRNLLTGFRQLEVNTAAAVAAVDEVLIDDVPVPFSAVIRPGDGFSVNLGRRIDQDGTFIQIRFRASIYRDATLFELRALDRRFTDGSFENVYQTAQPADIDVLSPGGELVVRFDADEDLQTVGELTPSVDVLTPNDDGVNDVMKLAFDLFKLTRPARATLTIHDLQGRRIRLLLDEDVGNGRHNAAWDGTDDDGRRVAPGTYLYSLSLDGDEGETSQQGVLGVVY